MLAESAWHLKQISYSFTDGGVPLGCTSVPLRSIPHTPASLPDAFGAVVGRGVARVRVVAIRALGVPRRGRRRPRAACKRAFDGDPPTRSCTDGVTL